MEGKHNTGGPQSPQVSLNYAPIDLYDIFTKKFTAETSVHELGDKGSVSNNSDQDIDSEIDPSVQRLQQRIENDPELMRLFAQAFEEIPESFQQKPDGHGFPRIHDYRGVILAIDRAIKMAPPWNSASRKDCVIACPMNEALVWLMNTRTGFEIFLREDINAHCTEILHTWAQFLSSEGSLSVINDRPKGWISKEALKELLCEVNGAHNVSVKGSSFEEVFECQPSLPCYGFHSWDDFFTRRFRLEMRPVAHADDDSVIVNPCESQPLSVTFDVPAKSEFMLKGTTYSVLDMLDNDSYAVRFVGGTVYHGWLSVFNYHRWHAAVSGTVLRVLQVRGTYFAAHPSQGFEHRDPLTGKRSPDGQAPDRSQVLISSIATRTIILIEADEKDLGVVGFVAIGMSEVSSCVPTVKVGDHVHKGQDIGSFHYGGSSYCLLFESGVKIQFSPLIQTPLGHQPEISGRCIAINSELGRLQRRA